MNNNTKARFKTLKKAERQALAVRGRARLSHRPKVGSHTFSDEQKKR